jgi:hypothetical protein
LLALLVWGALGGVCRRLARRQGADGADRRPDWFLLAWLLLELAGYFAVSPFPAARRVTGLLLVFTLLAGRLAHLQAVPPRLAGRLAACGAALALLFFITDLLEARAARVAAHEVAQGPYAPAEGGTFWHLSWWGLGYHADREGLRPLLLNRELPRPGDLLALHDLGELREALALYPEIGLEWIATVVAGDRFPLQVVLGYYAGATPLENQRDERLRVLVYRVTEVNERRPSAELLARAPE